MPGENFWTLWCKGRLTEADTPTIRLGTTPSRLTSAHLHHSPMFLQARCPSCRPTNSVKELLLASAIFKHCSLQFKDFSSTFHGLEFLKWKSTLQRISQACHELCKKYDMTMIMTMIQSAVIVTCMCEHSMPRAGSVMRRRDNGHSRDIVILSS